MHEAKRVNKTNYRNIELTDEGIILKRRGFIRSTSLDVTYSDVETVMLNEKKKRLYILKKDGGSFAVKKSFISPPKYPRSIDPSWSPLEKQSFHELHDIISERVERAKAKLRWQNTPLQFDVLNQQVDELAVNGQMNVCDLVELLLVQSVLHNASDIHIEPHQNGLKVRYRIDGFFHDIACIPEYVKNRLISRMKVISNLVIYKNNIPQEGSIRLTINELNVDFRVSIVPTIMGEKIVIRSFDILGASKENPELSDLTSQRDALLLESLGFTDDVLKGFESLILQNQGMIILTGPSGSGKTTTLYSALRRIHQVRSDSVSIVTIEDPVEYNLEVANQIQVNPNNGLTFAKALSSVLRQDPEVIMVGEIRDPETAEIAIQAGLTGHLVLTTVHSGTAAGVFTRLLDMGLEPFLVASSVKGVMAQRLVRVICPDCHEEEAENHYDNNTMINYKGRTAIAELLVVTDTLRELIMERKTTGVIEEKARELGMLGPNWKGETAFQTLKENGLQKVRDGITTEEELIRIL